MKTNPLLAQRFLRLAMPPRRSAGFALVIVMFLLALILLLVIAFAANMRTERKAAHNMAQGQRADLLADSALAHAVSLLANNIPDPGSPIVSTPVGTATNWFVNPGQLTLVDSAAPPKVTRIPLHSGAASAQNPTVAVNLNAASPVTGKHPITGADHPMWVSWINVFEDMSAPASKANPIVGRYAFWIDDESAKINFNTARGKPAAMVAATALPSSWSTAGTRDLHSGLTPTFTIGSKIYALGQPASVNLNSLGVDVSSLDSDVTSRGFFNQPEAIKSYIDTSVHTDAEAFYEQNKFQLTPFSRSPEFNVFGKSRIYTGVTASDLATGPNYQQTGHPEQPLLFWGYHAGVGTDTSADADAMRQVREPAIYALAQYLRRTDWPGMEASTFRWNTSAFGKEESDQIALNIASMGYWACTPTDTFGTGSLANAVYRWGGVLNSFPSISASPDTTFWKGPLSGKPMIPASIFPQITEVRCTVAPEYPVAGPNYRLKFNFDLEIYQPPGNLSVAHPVTGEIGYNNYSSSDTSGYLIRSFVTHLTITVTTATSSVTNTAVYLDPTGFARDLPKDFTVPRDGFIVNPVPAAPYYVGTSSRPRSPSESTSTRVSFSGPATVTVKARFGIASKSLSRLMQVVPVYLPLASAGPAEARPPSGMDDDAYLEFTFALPAYPDTLGYTQSREVLDPRMLAKKSNWPVSASDSLGDENPGADFGSSGATQWATWNLDTKNYNISRSPSSPAYRGTSIGMFSFVPTGMQRSIPFDSLRFYNKPPGAGELPDWLVLDLLAPTFPSPISLRNSTAGKINLNAKIYPEGINFAPPPRTAPLDALFKNMPHGTEAANAIRQYEADGGYFDYIGRICEVPGVADSDLGPTEYEQETLLRHLAGLMTTQSNTFSVWGVAQAIKKSPKNTDYTTFEEGDIVTAERRFRAVVERYVWSGKEGIPGNASTNTGSYIKAATSGTNPANPGAPPTTTYAGKTWAEIDGPQQPQAPAALGTVPYSATSLENANNPLAAAMKYRIIFWEYID